MFAQIRNIFFKKSAQEKGFSVICVYNDRQKLDDYLGKSLNRQTLPFELIAIDNTTGKFKSAAPLLNEAARKARYDYLMFAHQDVFLRSRKWLEKALQDLEKLHPFGAAGVAGKIDEELLASVRHGNPPHVVGRRKLRKPVRVQTLDGCLMIVSREIFLNIPFDEKAVDGWMLYVANYCLDLIRHGYGNFVLPHDVYHESTGCNDRNAIQKVMDKIIARHQDHIEIIYTTVGTWKTSPE